MCVCGGGGFFEQSGKLAKSSQQTPNTHRHTELSQITQHTHETRNTHKTFKTHTTHAETPTHTGAGAGWCKNAVLQPQTKQLPTLKPPLLTITSR